MRTRKNGIIAGVAAICFITGVALSHRIELGVRVQKVTLGGDTPTLKFIPTDAGPHSVAPLAHEYASSEEAFFRYGDALAAAGFVCYSVDQPGHHRGQMDISCVFCFIPDNWMNSFLGWFGAEVMPRSIFMSYVLRGAGLIIGGVGVVIWITATDVVRCRPVVIAITMLHLVAAPTY